MAAKPLTNEAIALTEKKMDMTLDDIIKMSKKPTSKVKKQRASIKSQNFLNKGAAPRNSAKLRQFMDSGSSIRQGMLSRRRSNFQGNRFPLATDLARNSVVAPIRNIALNRNSAVNWKRPRMAAPLIQRKAAGVGFTVKQQQQQQLANVVPKQRPQTLDSLFANMQEQRMRVLSQQNNARHVGALQQRGRGRFGNFSN